MKTTAYAIDGVNKYLRTLPKEASDQLRTASQRISDQIASEAAGRARGMHAAARLIAGTVRSRRDRVPYIAFGNSSKLPPHSDGRERRGVNQKMYNLMWGAEFGSQHYTQFPEWKGNSKGAGYFVWPTVDDRSAWMLQEWSAALKAAIQVAP